MKKLVFIAVILCCITSCGNKKTGVTEQSPESGAVASTQNVASYTLDSLLAVADRLVDQTVTVRGVVTHTCKHSGKRCFIVGNDQKTSFRVEAKGDIGGFNRELIGSELAITGVVKERRLTQEYIAQYEEQVKEKQAKEDGSAETCQAELNNVNGMREWMKANNKDYYSTYYMDGESFNVIEQ